ncbi:hypothetical protein GEMRC1_010323 [Eukaryota sp. GEM-RC1]
MVSYPFIELHDVELPNRTATPSHTKSTSTLPPLTVDTETQTEDSKEVPKTQRKVRKLKSIRSVRKDSRGNVISEKTQVFDTTDCYSTYGRAQGSTRGRQNQLKKSR